MEKQTQPSQRQTTGSDDALALIEKGRHVVEEINGLGSSVNELVGGTQAYVEDVMTERPYVGIAAAAGIGFVLAGGLSSRLALPILTAVGRSLLRDAANNLLANASASLSNAAAQSATTQRKQPVKNKSKSANGFRGDLADDESKEVKS